MKLISVVTPCYNEEGNVRELQERVCRVFANELPEYQFEFIDNASKDGTVPVLREIAGLSAMSAGGFTKRPACFLRGRRSTARMCAAGWNEAAMCVRLTISRHGKRWKIRKRNLRRR